MNRILIIGATSAIAQATARLWVSAETRFFLVARDAAKLSIVAEDLRTRGAAEVFTQVLDVNQCEQHLQLIDSAFNRLQGLDIALIAHGVLDNQADGEQSYTVALHSLQTNFLSVVSLLTPLANVLEKQRYGCIAVISSVAGDRGRQSNYIYGAAKGGLSLFLQGLRNRLSKANVNVLTIKPGFVDTPMTAHIQPKGALWATPEKIGQGIVNAIAKRKDIVYLPAFWWVIMSIIKAIPETIFKRLKL